MEGRVEGAKGMGTHVRLRLEHLKEQTGGRGLQPIALAPWSDQGSGRGAVQFEIRDCGALRLSTSAAAVPLSLGARHPRGLRRAGGHGQEHHLGCHAVPHPGTWGGAVGRARGPLPRPMRQRIHIHAARLPRERRPGPLPAHHIDGVALGRAGTVRARAGPVRRGAARRPQPRQEHGGCGRGAGAGAAVRGRRRVQGVRRGACRGGLGAVPRGRGEGAGRGVWASAGGAALGGDGGQQHGWPVHCSSSADERTRL